MSVNRSFWTVETVLSLALLVGSFAAVSAYTGWGTPFAVAELALIAISFLLARLVGGPGKVLGVGVALDFGLAVALAIAASSFCIDTDCGDAGEAWGYSFVGAAALYPGWALGTGLGALLRLATEPPEQRG
jgi:hypothetical protein